MANNNIALLSRAEQAISITEMAKSSKKVVDRLQRGEQDRYVIMRNNAPAAVMLSVEEYEALVDELEDLRIEAIAAERVMNMTDDTKFLASEEVYAKYK